MNGGRCGFAEDSATSPCGKDRMQYANGTSRDMHASSNVNKCSSPTVTMRLHVTQLDPITNKMSIVRETILVSHLLAQINVLAI